MVYHKISNCLDGLEMWVAPSGPVIVFVVRETGTLRKHWANLFPGLFTWLQDPDEKYLLRENQLFVKLL